MNPFDEIACTLFKLKPEDLRDSLTSKDIPLWDSMNYLLFIAELEKRFGVSFSMDEVMGAETLGDLRKTVEKRKK